MASAALHARQLRGTLVELVIADRRHTEAQRVQGVDGRLFVKKTRKRRRRANQVAAGYDDRVGVLGLVVREVRGEVFDAARRDAVDAPVRPLRRFECAVEVVDRQQLDVGRRLPDVAGRRRQQQQRQAAEKLRGDACRRT
jgi:hypothetical protein